MEIESKTFSRLVLPYIKMSARITRQQIFSELHSAMFLPQGLEVDEFLFQVDTGRDLKFVGNERDCAEDSVQVSIGHRKVVWVVGQICVKRWHL